jgi:hypothetical protein
MPISLEEDQMKGFMRQRGASWELRVFLGRDPVTGKKRYATKTVRGGKREAQSALAVMIAEAERGSMARTTATVGELLNTWFEFAAPEFSPKTVKETRGDIDRSLMPALGTRRLSKLSPSTGCLRQRSTSWDHCPAPGACSDRQGGIDSARESRSIRGWDDLDATAIRSKDG